MASLLPMSTIRRKHGPSHRESIRLRTWLAVAVVATQIVYWSHFVSRQFSLQHDPRKAALEFFKGGRGNISKKVYSYYNPWDRSRYVCGVEIPPQETVQVQCNDPLGPNRLNQALPIATVFPHKAPLLASPNQATKEEQADIPPVVVKYPSGGKTSPFRDCDVPCATMGQNGSPTILNVPIQFAAFSMEGPEYYPNLVVDPNAHFRHKYYATTSFESDIPLQYWSNEVDIFNPNNTQGIFEHGIKGASFMAKNCNSKNNREKLVKDLIQAARLVSETDPDKPIRIDSLSTCLKNADFPPNVNRQDKIQVMKRYVFHLAFENQNVDDYITEKLWWTLLSGSIPVYYGAPNIRDHLPSPYHQNSVVVVEDFNSTLELAKHLQQVAYNQTLFDSYQTWRLDESHFRKKYAFADAHSTCRMCRMGYAYQYGWGWDHKEQTHRPLKATQVRGTCLEERRDKSENKGMMVYPVKESWSTMDNTLDAANDGDKLSSPTSYLLTDPPKNGKCGLWRKHQQRIQGTEWIRSVWDHDGVTDMEISKKSRKTGGDDDDRVVAGDLWSHWFLSWKQPQYSKSLSSSAKSTTVLRLIFPINATDMMVVSTHESFRLAGTTATMTAYQNSDKYWQDQKVFWIQDSTSRVVLMVNETLSWGTRYADNNYTDSTLLPLSGRGIVDIPVDRPLRLRWIFEDVDTFHKGGHNKESFFSSVMLDDFFHPLVLREKLPTKSRNQTLSIN